MGAIRAKVKDRGDGLKKLVETLRKEVRGASVKAGLLENKAFRDESDTEGPSNADIGVVHEFGVPEHGIPERSFLRSAFASNQPKYADKLGRLLIAIVKHQKPGTAEKGLKALGFEMVKDIRGGILDGAGIPPPNSPAVLRRKLNKTPKGRKRKLKAKNGPSSEPRTLVDTGQLVKSLSHEVVLPGQARLTDGGGK